MTLPYRIGAGFLLILALFAAGYFTGRGQKEIQTVEKVVEKRVEVEVKGETHVEFRDRIVTVTRTIKPDGTTTETTKTEEKQKDTQKKETVHGSEVAEVKETQRKAIPPAAQYSLGLQYRSLPADLTSRKPVWENAQLVAGFRTLGPAWLEAGYTGRREVLVGVRVDF